MKKFALASLLLFTWTSLCLATAIEEVIKLAIQNNNQIASERTRLKITDYQYREAIGKFLPSVNLEFSRNRFSDVPSFEFKTVAGTSQFSTMEKTFKTISISLNQPMFTGGYLKYNLKKAKTEKTASFYRFQETVNRVINNVKKDYYTAVKAKTAVQIARWALKSTTKHYRDVESFFKEGIVARRDLLEASVKVKEAREKLTRVTAQFKIALQKLKKDIGLENATLKIDTVNMSDDRLPEIKLPLDRLIKIAMKKRPIIKLAKENIKMNKYTTRITISQFMPKVYLTVSRTVTDRYPGLGNFKNTYAGININLPVFEGSQRVWRLKKAKLMQTISQISLKEAKELTKLEVIKAYENLKSAKARIETAKAMIRKAEELLRDSKERYREHVGTSTDVVDAIVLLTHAKGLLNNAISDYNCAVSELEYAVGEQLTTSGDNNVSLH